MAPATDTRRRRRALAVGAAATLALLVPLVALAAGRGGSATATTASDTGLRPGGRPDRPRQVRGLPSARRDRPVRLPDGGRRRREGTADRGRRREPADAAVAAGSSLPALRRTGPPHALLRAAGDAAALGALAARAPRGAARADARRRPTEDGRHRSSRRDDARPGDADRVHPTLRGRRDRRLPLLPARRQARGGLLRHVCADRARAGSARPPRHPLPRPPGAGLRRAASRPRVPRAGLDVLRRQRCPTARERRRRRGRLVPERRRAGSPPGRPAGAATGCPRAWASPSRGAARS